MFRNKPISIFLTLVMMFSIIAPSAIASDVPGEIVVADFRTETLYPGIKGGSASQSGDVVYGDSSNSLSWLMSSEMEVPMDLGYNWKENKKVHIRFRAEESDLKFNIIFMDTKGKPWGKYKKYDVTANGEWQEVSFPISELLFVINNISGQKAIGCVLFNSNGWGITDYSKHKKIYIDQIWLTTADYGTFMNAPVCSVEYGAGYVSPDLDGSNNLSFEFEKPLYNSDDILDAFALYEVSGDVETKCDIDHTVSLDDNILNVNFASQLNPGVYKAVVDSSKIYSLGGAKLEEDFVTYFSVEMGSIIFSALSSNPENGAKNIDATTPGFKWEIEFNNEIKTDDDLNNYVTIYRDSIRLFEGFEISEADKVLSVTFSDELGYEKNYQLRISDSYKDCYGNLIEGNRYFSFTTAKEVKQSSNLTIFSAGNSSHMSAVTARGAAIENGDNLNINPKNAKIEFSTKDKSSYFTRDEAVETAGMKYINIWMYSPKATDYICNLVLYPSRATATTYHKYEIPVNWEGWKLISVDIGSKASIDSVMINFNGWQNLWPDGGYVLIDEIWYSPQMPIAPYVVESSIPDGFDGVKISGETFRFTFNSISDNQPNAVVTVTDSEGNPFEDFTYSFKNNELIVEFGTFMASSDYIITINGVAGNDTVVQTEPFVMNFKTADTGVYVSELEFDKPYPASGESIKISAEIRNINDSSADVNVNIAIFNVDGCLTGFKTEKENIQSGISNVDVEFENVPEGSQYAKVWITDSYGYILSGRYVLANGSLVYNTPVKLSGASAKISLESCEFDARMLKIKGNASGIDNVLIVEVVSPEDKVITKDIISAMPTGEFNHNLRLAADSKSGIYKVKVYHAMIEAEMNPGYMSDSDREKLTYLANSDDEDMLCDFLLQNSDILGVSELNSKRLLDLSEIIIEKDDYASYQDITAMISRVIKVFDNLNNCLWSELSDYITDNSDVLFEEKNKDIEYFRNLGSKAQNEISLRLFDYIPFDTISDFRKTFSDVISEYKQETQKKDDNKGSSGGGGGGGKVSGGASISGNMPVPTPYTPVESLETFKDLSGYEWAKESIMMLYSSGVVSASADSMYRPGDSITREEFVKLVVEAFFADKIVSSYGSYSDVKNGEWYSSYISTASMLGIVNGKPDGSFGIGERITREDLSSIACRALEVLGNDVSSGIELVFTDKNQISSYALGYVGYLYENGIVNGMGDGSFAPKSNANRAQAAKIIAGLVNSFK